MREKTVITIHPAVTTSNHRDNNNSKITTTSAVDREEGELPAPENDEVAGSHFQGSTIVRRALSSKDTNVEMGSSALIHNPTHTAITSRTSMHSKKRTGTEKKRVPFVISFSDDDSDSDSKEDMTENTVESDEVAKGVMKNKMLSTSLANSQMVQRTANTNIKMPKNLSISRTVSSMNRANGTFSKNGGSTSAGVKTHLKKSNPPSKAISAPNKVQDLRQLIAIRENESKSKSGKLDKEVASSAPKSSTAMNRKINAVRIRESTQGVLGEPKEPEKKRLKVAESSTRALMSVGKHDKTVSESTSGAKIPAIGIDSLKGKYDRRQKGIIGERGQSSKMQPINEVKNLSIPPLHPPSGSGIIRKSRPHNRAESSTPLMGKADIISPSTQVQRMNLHCREVEIKYKAHTSIKNLICSSTLNSDCIHLTDEYGSLNNSSFLNHFGAANTSATGNMDIRSLLEIEELQDKELDEAQVYRRKCEIEERNAFKAYRKAQRNLAEANTRCSYLYSKIRSNMMNDSSTFLTNMSHQHSGANMNSITNMSENNMPHHQVRNETEDGKNVDSESCSEQDTSGSEPREHKGSDSSNGEGVLSGERAEVDNESVTSDPTEDSLLLEATLRSQLFARLGIRISKKNETDQIMEPATVEREDGEIMEDDEIVPSDTDQHQLYESGDIVRSEKSICELPLGMKDQCDVVVYPPVCYGSFLTEPVMRTTFGHVKFSVALNSMQPHTDAILDEKKVSSVSGAHHTDFLANVKTLSLLEVYASEVGSYSNSLAINPFWPLCMFELRGKCNDDECPMQHARNYSSKSNDCNRNDSTGSLNVTPPTYLVCLDSLKSGSHPYKYLVAQSLEQRWQKYFSASLVVSSSIFADLHPGEPCLHSPETRIDVHGVWNRQLSYFHGNNANEGHPEKHMDDTYQPVEIALHNLSRDVNKQRGRREALRVLAQALEQHPTSVLLWIVYLHIYYSNQKSIGKDDLFRYAVGYNQSSYELWLMFINSRKKLDDRLRGYDTALSALCRHAFAPDRNPELDSECILDMYLQMLNFLCSCGQVNNAIQKAYTLLTFTKTSTDLLPELHTRLTVPDKYVLWVCCIYLILYKKLPDTIVQQFECQKELSAIEWPSVHLTPDESMQAIKLIELASEYFDNISDQIKKGIKSAEFFAVNHIKCTALLKGFDPCKSLLKKYIQLFPSCLELILLSVRVNGFDSTESTFAAFEEVLANWVGESGIQCVWNQYAESALENGRLDFAKELMERWFTSISEFHHPETKTLNISAWISSLNQTDIVFGLLNLALHKQLQNDHTEARIAIEQLIELASSTDYNRCVREHAMFSFKNGFGNRFGKAQLDSFLNMLNRYLMDPRASPSVKPLSRSFIRNIGDPKTQKIVANLLCPVSSDSSLLNLVLESCFGPSLLPFQVSERLTDDVDFAEALMELRPANYQLALSICKNLSEANVSISFWASAQLIDSLFQAVPVASESVWVEASSLLHNVAGFKSMLESFHRKALSVYPFSVRLWKSYLALDVNNTKKTNEVVKMAREKGIKL
ncbi:uncharacterized protein [Rutidosis leptorrhynchoides]|uniref:uncharacterized protein n=1 Tax=Rutidosis leptorrhynchoides TaxID=125765 RepID=UPI003A99B866